MILFTVCINYIFNVGLSTNVESLTLTSQLVFLYHSMFGGICKSTYNVHVYVVFLMDPYVLLSVFGRSS